MEKAVITVLVLVNLDFKLLVCMFAAQRTSSKQSKCPKFCSQIAKSPLSFQDSRRLASIFVDNTWTQKRSNDYFGKLQSNFSEGSFCKDGRKEMVHHSHSAGSLQQKAEKKMCVGAGRISSCGWHLLPGQSPTSHGTHSSVWSQNSKGKMYLWNTSGLKS